MLGLFGTLNLATRSLSTQRQGTEVSGHNLANVNNPGYSRQRLTITASLSVPDTLGPQGTGAEGVSITQLRNRLLDRQILSETSVFGSLDSQQRALQYAQANLGQLIDRQSSGAEGAAATGGVGGQNGLSEQLASLFNAFQSLSTNPTSTAERQVLLLKAQNVATQFNQVSHRLNDTHELLNDGIESDVSTVNGLLGDIAKLNDQVIAIEVGGGIANDLRDVRQLRLEELGKLVNFTTVEQPGGSIDIAIDGVPMTQGSKVLEQLESYDAGGGQIMVRVQSSGGQVNLSGGSIQGTIEARDGALGDLRKSIDTLAASLISEVNTIHAAGFGMSGSTGADFFNGADAGTIEVNAALLADPSKIQASGVSGATGDNQVILQLAQLGDKTIAALGHQTFSSSYGQTVASLGQSLSSINSQIDNQASVQDMLSRQRDSFSGVSLDEEMTDLIKFQKAFEASARLVSIVDEMLDVVVSMKR